MEDYNPSTLKDVAYSTIVQNGSGSEMDRYIYNQNGEGLGSFFGNIMKNAIPFLGKAIKGGWDVAKPHLAAAGKELVVAGAKKGLETFSSPRKRRTKNVHKSHKKRAKWQSL